MVRSDISEEDLDAFDPDNLRLDPDVDGTPIRSVRKRRENRINRPYAPAVPIDWVYKAAALPGRSLHVAWALCRLAALRKTTTIGLSTKWLKPWSVGPDAKLRALEHLENAGLIEFVERIQGHNPVIRIIGL
jgi:hypothetical protein